MSDTPPVLRSGMLAYLDTLTAGLIPCKVLSVRGKSGNPSSAAVCNVRFTASRGTFKRGEVWTGEWSLHVVPRDAVKRRKYGARIGRYTVEADTHKRS